MRVKGLPQPPQGTFQWIGPDVEPPNTYLPENLGGSKWKKITFILQRLEGQDIG